MKTKLQSLFIFFALFYCGAVHAQSSWTPEICNVTVDSATSTYISIMWEKFSTKDIDSFYVYRQNAAGGFDRIGAVAYEDSTVYDDIAVNVNTTQYYYALSTLDTNGIESSMSSKASSALLDVIPNASSGYFTCQWMNYNNPANPAVNLQCTWTSTGSTSLHPVGSSLSSSATSWNHTGYSASATNYYRLETQLSTGCTPKRGAINTSRSNIKTASVNTSQIISTEETEKLLRAYPNPTADNLLLEWNAALGVGQIDIIGVRGDVVRSFSPSANELKKLISLRGIAEGIYMVRFYSQHGIVNKRIIVM